MIYCLSNCIRLNCSLSRLSLQPVLRSSYQIIRQPITNNGRNLHFGMRTKLLQNQQNAQQRLFWLRLRSAKKSVPPEAPEKKVKLRRKDVVRFFSLAKQEKWKLAAAIGCLVISSSVTMCVPYALGKILDLIFKQEGEGAPEALDTLRNFSIILCVVFLLGGLANLGRVYLFNSASLRIVNNLRAKVYRTMLAQETGWFDTKGTGELINRLMNDSYFVGSSLSQNLSDGLRSAMMIVAGMTMMIYTSPKLTLLSTCVVPCIAALGILYGQYVRKITRELFDKFAQVSKFAEERLGNIKTVKSFSKEDEEFKSFEMRLNDALRVGFKEVRARSLFYGMSGFSGNVIIVSVLYYGGTLVVQESLTVGALTSFILYAGYLGLSINGLTSFYSDLNRGIGAVQRLWEIFDRQYAIPQNVGLIPVNKPLGELRFENVYFSYPGRPGKDVLNGLNLTCLPGQSTAIVGRSGCGKSTLGLLVLRLYDPDKGAVLLDGLNLQKLNPLWLRSHIGAVSQEAVLFSGTIRENILYGLNPGMSVSESYFNEIVRKAHVDEFTKNLHNGLDTIVGQRGTMLSGGQRQRVAIARALIKNPKILLLDEATSALDSLSEELVISALEELARGRTVLTIAHRLSTIRNADNIVVMDEGVICEEGKYEKLINSDLGTFRELVRKQAFSGASFP